MEKIIIVWEKEALTRMEFIQTIIASNATEILLINPEEYAKISDEEIIEEPNKVLILHNTPPEKLKKEIKKEFNRIFELKPKKIENEVWDIHSNQIPRYDRFIKKGWIKNSRTSKQQFKKKWNKHK